MAHGKNEIQHMASLEDKNTKGRQQKGRTKINLNDTLQTGECTKGQKVTYELCGGIRES